MHHLQQDQIDCSQPWLLLQEMTHRVRNEYGVAISALSLAAASASGKLAPHNTAPGRTANNARARSTWNVSQGLVERIEFTGQ